MKKVIMSLVVATGFLLGGTYTTDQSRSHVGERATVCGVVTGGYYARSTKGKPTFLNLDGRYPQHKFTILIWGKYRHLFKAPEIRYNGQRVCVNGVIELHKGVSEMEIEGREAIK
jgi:hypothetical protein